MSTARTAHQYKASRAVLCQSPALAQALQLRCHQSSDHADINLPPQIIHQVCSNCCVPWVSGLTFRAKILPLISNDIRRVRGGLNKRARKRRLKRMQKTKANVNVKDDSGDKSFKFVQTCLNCSYVQLEDIEKPAVKLSEIAPAARQPLATSTSNAKKRAKMRKQMSSLQQMVAKSNQQQRSTKGGLNLEDFMKSA